MKYGMNLLLWTGELNESLLPILDKLKSSVSTELNYRCSISTWTMRLGASV